MMRRARTIALATCALLGFGMTAAVAKPAPAPAGDAPGAVQLTSGPKYDRNASVVQDGKTTWMFFSRSQDDCNRLNGCTDADNRQYDLWAQTSKDHGNHWSGAQMIAVNPGLPFRGRTSAATVTSDGTVWVFWASGSNSAPLYYLSRDKKTGQWSLPQPVDANTFYFNVEVVAQGNTVYVYYEDGATGGVYERTFDGSTFSPATLVADNGSIPKVIIDRDGVFRMTFVDSTAWPVVDVYTTSSTDGLIWSPPEVVVPGDGMVTNWDPSLLQTKSGAFVLFYAPDTGDGNQHIAALASRDFVNWSAPVQVSSPNGFWDYWPEAANVNGNATLFYTSEAGDPAGTAHIWSLTAKDACKQAASDAGFKNQGACVAAFG